MGGAGGGRPKVGLSAPARRSRGSRRLVAARAPSSAGADSPGVPSGTGAAPAWPAIGRSAPSPGSSPISVRIGLSRSASSLSTRPNTWRTASDSRSAVAASTSRRTRSIGAVHDRLDGLRRRRGTPGKTSSSRRTARRPADCRSGSNDDPPRDLPAGPRGRDRTPRARQRSSMIVVPARPTTLTRRRRSTPDATYRANSRLAPQRSSWAASRGGSGRARPGVTSSPARPSTTSMRVRAGGDGRTTTTAQVVDHLALGEHTGRLGVELGEEHGGTGRPIGPADAPERARPLPRLAQPQRPDLVDGVGTGDDVAPGAELLEREEPDRLLAERPVIARLGRLEQVAGDFRSRSGAIPRPPSSTTITARVPLRRSNTLIRPPTWPPSAYSSAALDTNSFSASFGSWYA